MRGLRDLIYTNFKPVSRGNLGHLIGSINPRGATWYNARIPVAALRLTDG
jgi:hypothetical protein